MCGTCGCSELTADEGSNPTAPSMPEPSHSAEGANPLHSEASHHGDGGTRRILKLQEDILHRNDHVAAGNRRFFEEHAILALNLVSSPGAGKTTLLERLIRDRGTDRAISVIQGDQATERDAERIRAAGARAIQINTATGCHLDADMVRQALRRLAPQSASILAIENVGNLVCPALFDLGEGARVAVLSVPEGADKPIKYPYLFRGASLVLLNKTDLLPYVEFDERLFEESLRQVNPRVRCIRVSASTGAGLSEFYDWVGRNAPRSAQQERPPEPAR